MGARTIKQLGFAWTTIAVVLVELVFLQMAPVVVIA